MWETVYVFNNTGLSALSKVSLIAFGIEVLIIQCLLLKHRNKDKKDLGKSLIVLGIFVVLLGINVVDISYNYQKKGDAEYQSQLVLDATKTIEGELSISKIQDNNKYWTLVVDEETIVMRPMIGQNPKLKDGDIVRIYAALENPDLIEYKALRIDKRS